MDPRRLVLAAVALVAGVVAVLLARLRGGGAGERGREASSTGAAATAAARPLQAARRAAGRLPGVRDADADRPGGEWWTCQCGQRYRVAGEGRHRVYWAKDAPESDPVLEARCVSCERPLPGEHATAE